MIHNIVSNNQISFLFSKTNSIDLEALNLLAGKTEPILCGCAYCEDNGKHRLNYDVRLPSNLYLQRESFLLEKFIQACLEMFEVVDKHSLNLANIRIESRYIFAEQDRYQFLYLPVFSQKKANKKKIVIKFLTQFKDRDIRVCGLLKRVKSLKNDEAVLSYLRECIAQTKVAPVSETEGETSLLSQNVAKSEDETTILAQNIAELDGETPLLSQSKEVEQQEEEDETTILSQHITEFLPNASAECETTFLSETPFYEEPKEMESDGECTLFLLRVGTGEQIHINKSQYSIGKDIKTMDYVLGNESVSRNHATIYIEDSKFYLTDNGSTNGTTIEGIRVQIGERAELSDGDIVSLGNEVFQVLLERK